ncbi:MAG: imidazole glycerol phosphate synthase subunit HisH [Spirochaetota bacterium]
MIAVIDFGMGNLHSCLKAVARYSKDFSLINQPEQMLKAKAVILPGDGAFDAAMRNLHALGFIGPLRDFVSSGGYLFGICIGFQILFEDSDEDLSGKGDLIPGLGFIPGNIRRFRGKPYTVPHMGWNQILISRKNKILKNIARNEYMYFIHSYRATEVPADAVVANCDYYEEKFPVVIEKDNLFGTQFHPEKSDYEGLKILENFINLVQ